MSNLLEINLYFCTTCGLHSIGFPLDPYLDDCSQCGDRDNLEFMGKFSKEIK